MKEVWKPLPPFTKIHNGVTIKYDFSKLYKVSNTGKIRSLDRIDRNGKSWEGRERKLTPDKDGYLDVMLCKDGKMLKCKVHRLVATTFLENTDDKRTVNHIDGNKINNRVDNLEWATDSEQQKHAVTIGLRPKGEQCYNSKLTDDVVKEIRERRVTNPKLWTQSKLAEEYGVDQSQISRIIHRKLWTHV